MNIIKHFVEYFTKQGQSKHGFAIVCYVSNFVNNYNCSYFICAEVYLKTIKTFSDESVL